MQISVAGKGLLMCNDCGGGKLKLGCLNPVNGLVCEGVPASWRADFLKGGWGCIACVQL